MGYLSGGQLLKTHPAPEKIERATGLSVGEQGLRESCETALVDPYLNIAIPDALQIDHRRCDIAMPHPLLERTDVDSVLQVAGGVGVPVMPNSA
jgi:hypothetical protein